jgi:hypothetical protein
MSQDKPETVVAVIQLMPSGDGFPSLVETDSSKRYVMKLAGVGQGPRGLVLEFIAARLALALGLAVPQVAPIVLPKSLPWQTGTDEFYEALQRSAGWNLGVAYIEGASDIAPDALATLPPAFLDRLAAVDALLQNVDRTLKNPNLLRQPDATLWAIDFGSCLFLDRARSGRLSFALPPNHFLAGRLPALLSVVETREQLAAILADMPETWIDAMGGDRAALTAELAAILRCYAGWSAVCR